MSESKPISPRWSPTTKLVVAFTTVALVAALLVRFYNLIGPLLLAFLLAYLFQPMAFWLDEHTPLSWRWAVSIIYIVVILVLVSLLTLGGVGLLQQFQNLITLVQNGLNSLPDLVKKIEAGYFVEFMPLERIQTDIDAVDTGGFNFGQIVL